MAGEAHGTELGAEKESHSGELGAIKLRQEEIIIQVTGWWKSQLTHTDEQTGYKCTLI